MAVAEEAVKVDGLEEAGGADVVEDEQAAGAAVDFPEDALELEGEVFLFVLSELEAHGGGEAGEGEAEVGGVFAGDLPASAGVVPGEGVGVGEGEFGFAHAAEALDRDRRVPLPWRAPTTPSLFWESALRRSVSSRTRPTKAALCLIRLLIRRALAIDECSYGIDHPNVAIR